MVAHAILVLLLGTSPQEQNHHRESSICARQHHRQSCMTYHASHYCRWEGGKCRVQSHCEERKLSACMHVEAEGGSAADGWDESKRECYVAAGRCYNSTKCTEAHVGLCELQGVGCRRAQVCSDQWPLGTECTEQCAPSNVPGKQNSTHFLQAVENSTSLMRSPHGADPTVVTSFGSIIGKEQGGVHAWLGIPYALPPVGARRWAPPVEWESEYDSGYRLADEYGSTCMQTKAYPADIVGPEDMSEDCLVLNVWAPAQATPSSALPVMVFMHGGGSVSGTSTLPLYGGAAFAAAQNVIFVSVNYRLGVFGYLAIDEQTAAGETTGNWGQLDQRAALQWIQNQIHAFGGDASKVMLFGESAGAMSVCAQLVMRDLDGRYGPRLFTRAAMHSRSCAAWPIERSEQGGDNGNVYLGKRTGCPAPIGGVNAGARGSSQPLQSQSQSQSQSQLDCLRSLPADTLLQATTSSSWLPVVDGVLFDTWPHDMLAREAPALLDIPVITGATTDDGSIFVYPGAPTSMSAAQYTAAIKARFGRFCCRREWTDADTETVLRTYPPHVADPSFDHRTLLVQVVTDALFVCPARRTARTLAGTRAAIAAAAAAVSANGTATVARVAPASTGVYLYQWDCRIAIAGTNGWGSTLYHGAELPIVFGNEFVPWTDSAISFTSQQLELSAKVQRVWASFAKSGSPNEGGAASDWTTYDASADRSARIDWPAAATGVGKWLNMQSGWRGSFCDVWDALPGYIK